MPKRKKQLKYWKPNPALTKTKTIEAKQEVDKLIIERSKIDLRQRELLTQLLDMKKEFGGNREEIDKLNYQIAFFTLNKFDKMEAEKYKRGLQSYLMDI